MVFQSMFGLTGKGQKRNCVVDPQQLSDAWPNGLRIMANDWKLLRLLNLIEVENTSSTLGRKSGILLLASGSGQQMGKLLWMLMHGRRRNGMHKMRGEQANFSASKSYVTMLEAFVDVVTLHCSDWDVLALQELSVNKKYIKRF